MVHRVPCRMKGRRGERLLDICEVVLHFGRGQAPKEEKNNRQKKEQKLQSQTWFKRLKKFVTRESQLTNEKKGKVYSEVFRILIHLIRIRIQHYG
jgi:hypothetical protein